MTGGQPPSPPPPPPPSGPAGAGPTAGAGLRVITAQGTDPSLQAATIRNSWLLFGLVPLVGGLVQFVAVIVIAVTIANDPDHRGKHDELAGTAVVG